MNHKKVFSVAALVSLAAIAGRSHDAEACAVFTPDQTVPVQGHRMILSLANDKTTLWDQFSYKGAPASFGWILPIKGKVEVGVSSDALFNALGDITAPQVFAPNLGCPNSCDNDGGGGGFGNGGVEVIAHEVVGPYESVQLASQDPNALKDWLTANNFPIPQGVGPILDAYVKEGFGFLALKLLPEQGVDAVRPVRVTYPGAMTGVPLRLLAAGTGDVTSVTLFVVSEGKYEPTNAPIAAPINDNDLVWDFAKDTSNYLELRKANLAATGGVGWLVEHALPRETYEIQGPLQTLVDTSPGESGYGSTGVEPQTELTADLDALLGSISGQPWVTRLSADLTRKAFEKDLQLGASADQSAVEPVHYASTSVNTPECPPDPCGGEGGGGGTGGNGGNGGTGANGGNGNTDDDDDDGGGKNNSSSGCSIQAEESRAPASALAVIGLGLALGLARRVRRR